MKLLVGSVFVDDSPIQERWLDLQLKFLGATTEEFEHVVVLWVRQTDAFFKKTNVIEPKVHYRLSEAHSRGLTYLTYYFSERMEEFDAFLFLDSDAFPIKKGWLPELMQAMEPRPVLDHDGVILTQLGNSYEIAAAIRTENLEQRLHASVLFVKDRQHLPKLKFPYERRGLDLKGDPEEDILILPYEDQARHLAFPLMRSNRKNVHPLASGVYYDMFYHHCCGSRDFKLRANEYWQWTLGSACGSERSNELMSDPTKFVSDLAGWSTGRYAC